MPKVRRRICAREARPVQVAAVCYRQTGGSTRFLLVRTSSGRWTFPKGQLEHGLSHAQVAALEAFEEGGVDGKVDSRPIGTYLNRKESLRGYRTKDVTVLAFLLKVRKATPPAESHRTPRWFTPSEAKQRLVQRRPAKYLRSIEHVFNSALLKIRRNNGQT